MSEMLIPKTTETGNEAGARAQDSADSAAPAFTAEEWAIHVARVKEARGKFAWVRTSSEEFSRRKQEDIDLEEEQSERRMA
jgi:hypothetical protein